MNTQLKSSLIILASLLLTISTASYKADEFSYSSSITLASQYLFRGFDMTQENPAIQGDYVISHESGFWFGAWGSNYDLDFDDGVEIDLIAGYDLALSSDVTLTLGMTEYTYTGEVDSSTEFYLTLAYSYFSFTYNDDIDLDTTYISLDAEFPLTEQLNLALHLAEYDYEDTASNRDYNASLVYSVNDKLSVFATYSSNDIDEDGAEDYVVLGVNYSFY